MATSENQPTEHSLAALKAEDQLMEIIFGKRESSDTQYQHEEYGNLI